MAVAYKVLGEEVLYWTANTNADWKLLYSVPENRSSIITSIIFCRLFEGGPNAYVDLLVVPNTFDPLTSYNATPGNYTSGLNYHILYKSKIIELESKDFRSSLTLEYGKSLYARSTTYTPDSAFGAIVTATVFGSENT